MRNGSSVPTSVPTPSADLITYRFDQADKRFAEMNGKLDTILMQNSHLISEERAQAMIDSSVKAAVNPLRDILTTYRNWGLAFLGSATTILCTVLILILRKGAA